MSHNPLTVAKRRIKRLGDGFCSQCPNPAVVNKTMCKVCLTKVRERTKKRLGEKKANKICVRCSDKAKEGSTHCENCLKYLSDRRKEKISSGICAKCSKVSRIGKTLCDDCNNSKIILRKSKEKYGICGKEGCYKKISKGTVCDSCIEKRKNKLFELKNVVLSHYGQKCNCSCGCQVTNRNHLTIDHINNDGAEQRRASGSNGGHANYRRIIKANFPTDLQVLCWNCNCAKHFYGGCK